MSLSTTTWRYVTPRPYPVEEAWRLVELHDLLSVLTHIAEPDGLIAMRMPTDDGSGNDLWLVSRPPPDWPGLAAALASEGYRLYAIAPGSVDILFAVTLLDGDRVAFAEVQA